MAKETVSAKRLSIRQACIAFGVSEHGYRYERKLSCENAQIAQYLVQLT